MTLERPHIHVHSTVNAFEKRVFHNTRAGEARRAAVPGNGVRTRSSVLGNADVEPIFFAAGGEFSRSFDESRS